MAIGEPRLRSDLVTSRQDGFVVVKDPAAGRFFRLREVEHFIASQLDGATSLGELRERIERKFGAAPNPDVVAEFVARLQRFELLETMGTGPEAPAPQARRVRGDLLHLRLAAFDPDHLLDGLVGKVRLCFTPYFVALSAPLIAGAIGTVIGQRAEIARDLIRVFRVETVLPAWLAIFVVAAVHEFAHGLTCKHFGGHVREMGFLLIYFQLGFYCNVSDAWLLPEKTKRLLVTLAGPYFELVFWALAVLTWRFTDSGGWLHAMALVVVATSAVRFFFNFNPLIRLDGYYLLSDALGVPNLRARAFRHLSGRLAGLWARLRGRPARAQRDASPRERRIFLTYGLLAGGYSAWLLSWIAWALGSLLTGPYEGLGAVLSAGLLVAVLKNRLERLASGPALAGAWRRLAAVKGPVQVLLALGAVLAVLVLGRTELTVAGRFTVAPRQNAAPRVTAHGIAAVTAEIAVPEREIGDVKLGQPVALEAQALSGKSLFGRVTAIAPAAATEGDDGWLGRVARVTTVVDDADRLLMPGMIGNAKIYCGERRLVNLLTRRRILDALARRLARFLQVGVWSWR